MRIWELNKQLDKMGLNGAKLNKTKLNENRIDLSKILLKTVSCWNNRNFVKILQKPYWGFTEILLKFWCLLNLSRILSKIWAGVMALTARNYTKIDMGFRSSRIWSMKFIKNILAVVKEMKGFPDREIIFLIDVILKKQRIVLFIKLGI